MCEPELFRIELRIPRSCEFVRVARKTAGALAHQLQFNIHDVGDIELAIGEVCTNAVEHIRDEGCSEILLRFLGYAERLVMEVIDRGPGFDPAQVDQGGFDDRGDVGGLGLLVVRSIMDELDVKCECGAGACVRMVKYHKRQ
jgi:serine/threonine-protein kinase RsbW